MGNSQSTELQLAVMGNILLQREIPHTDRQFWERLLSIGLSAADIFDNFTLDFLRSLRDRRQQNFATLAKLLALQLHAVAWRQKQTLLMLTAASLTAPQQPTAPPAAAVPAAAAMSRTVSAEGAAGGAAVAAAHPAVALEGVDGEKKQLLLNCIRLLSRVLAVVNEAPQEGMRQWLQGGVLHGMQELHEEDRKRRLQARQRKEKERRQQEESISRAKEIAAEKEKQEALRREEERKKQQHELELRVQREAKEAMQAAEAAQTKAKEARQAAGQAASVDGDAATPTHASPFSTTPASPTTATAGQAAEEFAQEEDGSEQSAEAAAAAVSDGQPVEAAGDGQGDKAHGASSSAVSEAESNFAFITAAVANQEAGADTEQQKNQQGTPRQQQEPQSQQKTEQQEVKEADNTAAAATAAVPSSADARPAASAASPPETAADAAAAAQQPVAASETESPAASGLSPASSSSTASPTGSQPAERRVKSLRSADPPLDEWWTGQLFGSPLSSVIVSVLMDLAFIPGFTLPAAPTPVVIRQELDLGKCWAVGVGFPPKLAASAFALGHDVGAEWELDVNRVELLRCMLAACSAPMFCRKLEESQGDAFIQQLVSGSHPQTTTLAFSLLNVVLSWKPETVLPYSYAISTDYRQPLVEICLQLLMILLDRQMDRPADAGSNDVSLSKRERRKKRDKQDADEKSAAGAAAADIEQSAVSQHGSAAAAGGDDAALSDAAVPVRAASSPTSPSSAASSTVVRPPAVDVPDDVSVSTNAVLTQRLSSPTHQQQAERLRALPSPRASQQRNIFTAHLFSLSPPDLTYLFRSVCRLLHHGMMAACTYLPGSAAGLSIESELFVLLWKYFDQCDAFLPLVLEQGDVLSLVTPLLYYAYDARKDSSRLGLMYTCVFILLKLSGERDFSVELNKTIPAPSLSHIPLLTLLALPELSSDSNYADALIVVAHRLITGSPHHLDALLRVLLTLLANISPYITRLSAVAASRLVSLFELFTAPSFLYSAPTHHHYILLLLDCLNNAIQYQWSGSSQLVLAIVRRARVFYTLRPLAPGEAFLSPMTGVGAKGHAVVFQRQQQQSSGQQGLLPPPFPESALAGPTSPTRNAAFSLSPAEPAAAVASQSGVMPVPAPAFSRTQSSTGAPPASPSLAQYATASFTPTGAWAAGWKAKLPLETIFRMFDFLLPKVEAMARSSPQPLTDAAVLNFIASQTLVGILPLPHAIVVRRYIRNAFTNNWFSVYLWGLVFLRQQQPKLFDGKRVRLFAITGKGAEQTAAAAEAARPEGGAGGAAAAAEQQEEAAGRAGAASNGTATAPGVHTAAAGDSQAAGPAVRAAATEGAAVKNGSQ